MILRDIEVQLCETSLDETLELMRTLLLKPIGNAGDLSVLTMCMQLCLDDRVHDADLPVDVARDLRQRYEEYLSLLYTRACFSNTYDSESVVCAVRELRRWIGFAQVLDILPRDATTKLAETEKELQRLLSIHPEMRSRLMGCAGIVPAGVFEEFPPHTKLLHTV